MRSLVVDEFTVGRSRADHVWRARLFRWMFVEPGDQALHGPAVDDSLGRDSSEPSMCDGPLGVAEFVWCVGVAVEREETARRQRMPRECVVDVLARWIT